MTATLRGDERDRGRGQETPRRSQGGQRASQGVSRTGGRGLCCPAPRGAGVHGCWDPASADRGCAGRVSSDDLRHHFTGRLERQPIPDTPSTVVLLCPVKTLLQSRVKKNPASHLNFPEDLAGGADVPEGDTMSVPTSTPVRPVPTRLGREQCPACRSFLPARKAAAVCPRCGQPIKTGGFA